MPFASEPERQVTQGLGSGRIFRINDLSKENG
jgi:hypothetical protein